MMRSVLLHGNDDGGVREVAEGSAEQLKVTVTDLRGQTEASVLALLKSGAAGVVVLSSEVLLNRTLRVEAVARATVVALEWPKGESWFGESGGSGKSRGALNEVVRAQFREAHAYVPVGEDWREAVVEVVRAVGSNSVAVAAGEQSYLVDVGRDLVTRELSDAIVDASSVLYLTDANVERLHGARLAGALKRFEPILVKHVLTPGEEQKRLGTLGEIFDAALAGGVDRSGWVVAAGGGVTTDIGGLVAALWMRGLRWVGVPTTLLAMVDASVGGKTAVDHGRGKNAVGAFWQPSRVLCDVGFLRTEAERNYVGGLSEVVKSALIGDAALFGLLQEHRPEVLARDTEMMAEVVRRCVQVKARIVGLDEREGGIRATLNLGHTLGHALEALGEYKRYTHGEAVSIGMVAALGLGVRLGVTPKALVEQVESMLIGFGLPVRVEHGEMRAAAALLGHDKKRSGKSIRVVLAHGMGDVRCEKMAMDDLHALVAELYS